MVFKADDDCGAALEGALAEKVFTISSTPKPAEGDKVVVYYMKTSDKAQTINIKATSFPKDFIVYGDTVMKGEDGSVKPYRMTVYKAHPQSTMSLAFSNNGDPGTVTITCDLLADEDGNLIDMILEDEE